MSNQENICSICKKAYQSPKSLNCLHVFCYACIQSNMVEETNSIVCNICQEVHHFGDESVHDLPVHLPYQTLIRVQEAIEQIASNSQSIPCHDCIYEEIDGKVSASTAYCVQCQQFMCDFDKNAHERFYTTHVIKSFEDFGSPTLKSLIPPEPMIRCIKHKNMEISMYCQKCDVAYCECCKIDHSGHGAKPVGESEEILSEVLTETFDKANEDRKFVKNLRSNLLQEMRDIKSSRKQALEDCKSNNQHLHDIIDSRMKHFATQINNHFDVQEVIFEKYFETIETYETKFSDAESYYKSMLQLFPIKYFFSNSKSISTRLTSLKDVIPKRELKGHTIQFEIDPIDINELEAKIGNIGKISRVNVPDFNKSCEVLTAIEIGAKDDLLMPFTNQEGTKLDLSLIQKNKNDTNESPVISRTTSPSNEIPSNNSKSRSVSPMVTNVRRKNAIVSNAFMSKFGNDLKPFTYEDKNDMSEQTNISEVKKCGSSESRVAYDQQNGQVLVLNKENECITTFKVRDETQTIQRNHTTSSSGGVSRSNSRPGSRMSRTNSPDCVFVASRDGSVRPRTCSPFPSSSKSKSSDVQTQALATNSKNQILVAHENEPAFSAYNMKGDKLVTIEYERYLGSPVCRTMSTGGVKSTPGRLSPSLSRSQVVSPLSRSNSGKSTQRASLGSQNARSLITTDNLDNIYIYRQKHILTFDANQKFIRKDRLKENTEPVSFSVNPFGDVYVVTNKGLIHRYSS